MGSSSLTSIVIIILGLIPVLIGVVTLMRIAKTKKANDATNAEGKIPTAPNNREQ